MQQAAQQAAMIALGAGSYMPNIGTQPSLITPPPAITIPTVTELTPAQLLAKQKAQVCVYILY
jgi:hypothetical protein